MAQNLSIEELKKAHKNFYGNFYDEENIIYKNILLIKKKIQNRVLNYRNLFKRKLHKKKKIKGTNFTYTKRDTKAYSNEFSQKNYTFIDNFLDKDSVDIINSIWPPNYFFNPPIYSIKNYNFGFRYTEGQFKNLDDFNKCQNFKNFYHYLLTDKFTNYINELINKKGYKIYSIIASVAGENSYLIPHQDTMMDDREIVNVIFFIDGGLNPKFSGGTGIYEDNEFKKPIFIPTTVKNSAIIYNSRENFFHGFDIIKEKTLRKAVSFQLVKN